MLQYFEAWCVYDFNNEAIYWCDADLELSDAELRENKVKLPVEWATRIRKAKTYRCRVHPWRSSMRQVASEKT